MRIHLSDYTTITFSSFVNIERAFDGPIRPLDYRRTNVHVNIVQYEKQPNPHRARPIHPISSAWKQVMLMGDDNVMHLSAYSVLLGNGKNFSIENVQTQTEKAECLWKREKMSCFFSPFVWNGKIEKFLGWLNAKANDCDIFHRGVWYCISSITIFHYESNKIRKRKSRREKNMKQ